MQPTQLLLPIVLFGAFAAYAVFSMAKRKRAMSNLAPAYERFFVQTGYHHAELVGAAPAEQAKLSEHKMAEMMAGKGHDVCLVRDVGHGRVITHRSSITGEYRGMQQVTTMSCSWSLAIGRAPAVVLQVADRSLTGAGKVVKELFSNRSRSWQPIYPTAIETGDAELDKRFVIYGVDAQRVRYALAQPQVRAALLSCTEVDLTVRADGEVRFSDPFQKNLLAGMGGTMGAMAAASDPGKAIELQIPTHDRIASLLASTAAVCA